MNVKEWVKNWSLCRYVGNITVKSRRQEVKIVVSGEAYTKISDLDTKMFE